jgi:hypothetical protein
MNIKMSPSGYSNLNNVIPVAFLLTAEPHRSNCAEEL